jgi:hypothetical protein
MKLKDQALWDKGVANNQDPYGARVFSYAKDWAELLEARIPEGATPAEVTRIIVDNASKDSHTADTDGITGFMYGAAVSTLSATWQYGEELRRWHNLETQIGNEGERANEEGGTLNPALMSFGN